MNNKVIGTLAGVLIIGLALTAGKQFGRAETNGAAYSVCAAQSLRTLQQVNAAQDLNGVLQTIIDKQQLELNQLRGLQAHELPSGRVVSINPNYNTVGGYVAACGSLPGVLGDDC